MIFLLAATEVLANRRLLRRTLLLLPVLAVLLALALWRLTLTYDLAFFLPAPQTASQQVLVERLGQGPGANLLFVSLPQASSDQAAQLAERLRASTLFERVWPDPDAVPEIPELVQHNRLLLGALPASSTAWQALFNERLADISSAPDDAVLAQIAADPALLAVRALSAAQGDFDPLRLQDQDPPLLVLRSVAPAFNMDEQQRIDALLRSEFKRAGLTQANVYGSGMYGVTLQESVRRESVLFSTAASVALALLILWRFRSAAVLLSTALPLLFGGVCGLLALSLLGNAVHGITLAFGFTLLGVAIDYPLHLFNHHALRPGQPTGELWATLRLGILSTLLAYSAFLLSGASGLLQLGVFACVGIAAAALCTAYLEAGTRAPATAPPSVAAPATTQAANELRLNHGPWLFVIALSVPGLSGIALFNDDLGALTPVPVETLAADSALRRSLGAVDLRYLLAVRQGTAEQALQVTEALQAPLQAAIADGLISGARSVTSLLPSRERQQQRHANITSQPTETRFSLALSKSSFRPDAFAPFLQQLQAERARTDWLEPQDYLADPDLAAVIGSALYQSQDQWVSLLFIRGLQDPQALETRLQAAGDVQLIDLKQAAVTLVSDYRQRLLLVMALALLAVAGLLWLQTRDLRRAIWLLGTVVSAVALAAWGKVLLISALSLFDLMALALVAGLGLDYALFYSRRHALRSDQDASHRAVTLCAASSLLVFGILAWSSIPLLRGIGATVALGVSAAFLLALGGRFYGPDPVNRS